MASVNLIGGYPIADDYGVGAPLLAASGAGATFTSPVIANVGQFGLARRIVGAVFADQAGTVTFQGSVDGTNWKTVVSATPIVASTMLTFDQVVYFPLNRVQVANTSGTLLTVFILSISARTI